jgi:hypothetical protein
MQRILLEVTLSTKKIAKRKKEDSAKASIGQKLPFLCVKQGGGGPPVRNAMYTEKLQSCTESQGLRFSSQSSRSLDRGGDYGMSLHSIRDLRRSPASVPDSELPAGWFSRTERKAAGKEKQ